jgi:Cutinase
MPDHSRSGDVTSLAIPDSSPFLKGPYQTTRMILGEDYGTQGLPQPILVNEADYTLLHWQCRLQLGLVQAWPPSHVKAAVYYPYHPRDHRVPTPNPLAIMRGPFPVLLYAHGFRDTYNACRVTSPIDLDFTSVDTMLTHVASYGFVCIAPDLSWLPEPLSNRDEYAEDGAFTRRAKVLVAYWLYLASHLNSALFAQQLDLSRVVFVGHSTGGAAATRAGRDLSLHTSFRSITYGLIAPVGNSTTSDVRNLVVLRGTLDTLQLGINPQNAYATAATPKTLVAIEGANHFGYTDLCDVNNTCKPYGINDPSGTISRADQQQTAASYLAALVRFYTLGDATAGPYLSGQQMVEGLETLGIQVQSEGIRMLVPPLGPTIGAPINP